MCGCEDGAAILAYLQAKAPPVYDPFCGGGSIPLEAQRLGLRAIGSDLNPVAVLISKALVEIPPRFAGRAPVNPGGDMHRRYRGAQGLAEDVRHYGQWMRDEAERRIGHLYPKARLPDGSDATVIAWLWARTVRSPDPRAKGAMVPLVSSFMLSTKEGKKAWVERVIDPNAPDGWRFEVRTGALGKTDEERLKKGTKSAKGQAFICTLTGSAINRGYIQAEGKADRLGSRLLAIVAEGGRRRIYVGPDAQSEAIAKSVEGDPIIADAREGFLSAPTPTRAMITGGVYPTIAKAVAELDTRHAYLDGELCGVGPDGITAFNIVQLASDSGNAAALVFFLFDLLYFDGEDLRERPLIERKERLGALLADAAPCLHYSDHVVGQGPAFYDKACAMHVEGIVSKRIDAPYTPGNRGLWRKVKCLNRAEFVVAGWTDPEGRRPYLGALLLGYYDPNERLIYAGRVGSGIANAELERLWRRLQPLATGTMPFDVAPPRGSRFGSPLALSRVHWVRPELVVEVKFLTWTEDNLLRQVVYEGLREDKPQKEVRREVP